MLTTTWEHQITMQTALIWLELLICLIVCLKADYSSDLQGKACTPHPSLFRFIAIFIYFVTLILWVSCLFILCRCFDTWIVPLFVISRATAFRHICQSKPKVSFSIGFDGFVCLFVCLFLSSIALLVRSIKLLVFKVISKFRSRAKHRSSSVLSLVNNADPVLCPGRWHYLLTKRFDSG